MSITPQILFVSPTVRPGDVVHVNSTGCHAGAPWREYTQPIIVITCTEHSDYSGGPTERSNHRGLIGTREIQPHLIRLIGSYGYRGLAYQAYLGPVPLSDELADLIDCMTLGEAIDDDDVSDLKCTLESEAWEEDGRKDFVKALNGVLDAMDSDFHHDVESGDGYGTERFVDEGIDELWNDGCEALNVNGGTGHVVETGCVVHFYVDDWAKRVLDPRWNANKEHLQADQIADLMHRLRNLCMRTRVV